MKLKIKALSILLIGIMTSVGLPHLIISLTSQSLKQEISSAKPQTVSNQVQVEEKKDTVVPVQPKETVTEPEIAEETKEEPKEEIKEEEKKTQEQPVIELAQADPAIPYEQMTNEQLINSIANGTFKLEYTAIYNTNANKLTKSKGVVYYNNHKETYYSQNALPGTSLRIPGRHVADDGTVRDGEGYICVAANSSYMSKGTVVKTSLGPAKVYDSGCASGTIDIYTNW